MTGVQGLIRLAERGADNRRWYQHTRATIGRVCVFWGWERELFSDVLAVFSPRTMVSRNMAMAVRYMQDGTFLPDVMRSTRVAVEHYRATGEIRGPKTRPFAAALRGDNSVVVLDTHMLRAFKVPIKDPRKAVRRECEKRVRITARRLGVREVEAQAMIWAGFYRTWYKQGNVPRYKADNVVPF